MMLSKRTRARGRAARAGRVVAGGLVCLALTSPGFGADDPSAPAASNSAQSDVWIKHEFDRFRAYARFDRAYAALAMDRLADAARQFEEGLVLDPGNLTARLGYADVLSRRGQRSAALQQIDVVLGRDPASLAALRLRAPLFAAAGAIRAAIADYRAAAAHPDASAATRRVALEAVADFQLASNDNVAALATLNALAADRADAGVLARRAQAYEKLQRFADAAASYRAAAATDDDPGRHALFSAAARATAALVTVKLDGADTALAVASVVQGQDVPGEPAAAASAVADESIDNAAARGTDNAPSKPEPLKALARPTPPPDPIALAQRRAREGRVGDAVAQLERLSNSGRPRSMRIRALRALAALSAQAGDSARVRAALERLVEVDPTDSASHAALARAYVEQDDNAAAVRHAYEALALSDSSETLRLLGFAQARAGDWQGTVETQRRFLERRDLTSPQRVEALDRLAFALDSLGRYREAADALEHLVAEPDGASLSIYERLAHACMQAGDLDAVLGAYRRALNAPQAGADELRSIRRRLAALQQELGQSAAAIGTYEAMLAADPTLADTAEVRLTLGSLLRSQGRFEEAVPHLQAGFEKSGEPAAALELAYAYKAQERSAEAVAVLERARSTSAPPEMRKRVLDELGYLLEAQREPAHAAAVWHDSLAVADDPRIGLARAGALARAGQRDAALAALDALAASDSAQPQSSAALDLRWKLENDAGRHAQALAAAEQAVAREPSAARRFHVGLSASRLGRWPQAIAQLEQAVAEDSLGGHLHALAYAYRDAGMYPQAARTFETLLQRDPQQLPLYADLAYTYQHMGDNARAIDWFKRAIDLRLERAPDMKVSQAPGTPLPAIDTDPQRDAQLRAMRDEVRKLSEMWSASFYESLRSNRGDTQRTVVGGSSTGVIPSQGAAELTLRPPIIGLRDERTFDVVARMLWSNRPSSLAIESDSLQGGIGVRYKPLREQSLYVSVERLIKIGADAQNSWLLRASYGWSDGYDMRIDQESWNYTTLFTDLGRFTDDARTWAAYVEGRQGRSFKVNENWIVTPHVAANARRQWPDRGDVNYAEAGVGVSARYLFNESKYATARSSAEFLLQYKKGFAAAQSGWIFTTVLRF